MSSCKRTTFGSVRATSSIVRPRHFEIVGVIVKSDPDIALPRNPPGLIQLVGPALVLSDGTCAFDGKARDDNVLMSECRGFVQLLGKIIECVPADMRRRRAEAIAVENLRRAAGGMSKFFIEPSISTSL